MNKLAVFLVCLMISGCGASRLQRGNGVASRRAIENGIESTVGFYSHERGQIFCTGFFVEKDIVVTAKHCVVDMDGPFQEIADADRQDPTKDLIKLSYYGSEFHGMKHKHWVKDPEFNNPKTFSMKVVYLNNRYGASPSRNFNDIAVLKVTNKEDFSKNHFKIASYTPFVGEKVYSFGMPLDMDWMIFEGSIARHQYLKNNKVGTYLVDIFIAPGCSGGPLVDYHGNVVGVNSGGYFLNIGPESHLAFTMGRDKLSEHVKIAKKLIREDLMAQRRSRRKKKKTWF